MHTPAMPAPLSDPEEHALSLDGHSVRIGSMHWPHPAPPLLKERASMVSSRIPDWAIARGQTAGWVWTGMGRAEPWALIAPPQPAISPMARQAWRPLTKRVAPEEIAEVGALSLLSPRATVSDLLTCRGLDEQLACQLFTLLNQATIHEAVSAVSNSPGYSKTKRERLRRRVTLIRLWWAAHPDVTR